MLPPLPRCSSWAWSSLISPSRVSLPRKGRRVGLHVVLFEACSAFTRVAACTLARSPYFVTRYPKASDISSPPCLLRLLPAGAVAGWGLHPQEKRRLVTAHTRSGHQRASEVYAVNSNAARVDNAQLAVRECCRLRFHSNVGPRTSVICRNAVCRRQGTCFWAGGDFARYFTRFCACGDSDASFRTHRVR